VVKSPTEEEMIEIEKNIKASKKGINTHLVEDAGHTQIKAGSRTILAIGPAFSNEIDPFTEHLKLV
jgi:PTH2 family peptidyl-tRNA hydrolase